MLIGIFTGVALMSFTFQGGFMRPPKTSLHGINGIDNIKMTYKFMDDNAGAKAAWLARMNLQKNKSQKESKINTEHKAKKLWLERLKEPLGSRSDDIFEEVVDLENKAEEDRKLKEAAAKQAWLSRIGPS
tara:strand:+ start:2225 stop:2614 length:390 start_codon:yes stop_codon:yes gene_type:complete